MMKNKNWILFGLVLVAIFVTANAYAGGDPANCPIRGFFHSVGGFLYNALPWNWGNWWGK